MKHLSKFLPFLGAGISWQVLTALPQPVGNHTLEAGFETLIANDIQVIDSVLIYSLENGSWEYDLTLGAGYISLDYVPAAVDAFFHREERLTEDRLSAELALTRKATEHLDWSLTLGGYDGFTGYRSLWISNWYQLNFEGFPGLEEPSPHGYYGSSGLRWDYRPGTGVLQSAFTWAQETIAPAFDEVFNEFGALTGVAPLRSELETYAWQISTENVLSARLRTHLEYRLAKQSERELRQSLVGRAHFTLLDRWFLQLRGGGTYEAGGDEAARDFKAWWGAATVLWEMNEHWTWDLGTGFYRDNGEIENSIGFSSAAPGLKSWSTQAGVRYFRGPHAFRLSVGWREATYGETDFENQFFEGLYRSRDFFTTSISYRINF
jgi:hypothetical protein